MKCLHQINPVGGFAAVHKHWCYSCDEDATCHVRVDNMWCANCCTPCGKSLKAKHPSAEIAYETVTEDRASEATKD